MKEYFLLKPKMTKDISWGGEKHTAYPNSKVYFFYKNVLAKTVHTEIHIFGPIEIGGDLGSKIWLHEKFY